jgi:hypothetical protein
MRIQVTASFGDTKVDDTEGRTAERQIHDERPSGTVPSMILFPSPRIISIHHEPPLRSRYWPHIPRQVLSAKESPR